MISLANPWPLCSPPFSSHPLSCHHPPLDDVTFTDLHLCSNDDLKMKSFFRDKPTQLIHISISGHFVKETLKSEQFV